MVATTAMLAFITFWRAAAIVLNDLASSAYYAGGIAEQAVGRSAPWFILAVMLFSYAVRAIYVESCSMFVRGGVYRVVKEAMGGTLAKFSVSALMFDYILTGPISGVSAGQYLVGFLNEVLHYLHLGIVLPGNLTAAAFAILVTLYFWWQNIKGIPESSEKALRIMQFTTVMVVLLIGWCGYTLWMRGGHLPPLPTLSNLHFSHDALGWLSRSRLPQTIGLLGIFIGLGHSILAMSGEESLAQVYREIEHPKLPNLKRAGLVIFVYSLVFTSLVSFFAVMIIPDATRKNFFENLIGGLAMNMAGPLMLRLVFHAFVVLVGTLILAGAVNTAIVGSNGVLNRVSEDGVLADWFRRPHPRFGTSYRIIDLVVGLQLLTIILSRGNVYLLGAAYAFGVIWSFVMKGLAVLVLRYKNAGPREYRVPLNLRLAGREIPIGLGLITLALLGIALVNLLTKQVATISGIAFTIVLFGLFTVSEKLTHARKGIHAELDQFHLVPGEELTTQAVGVRPVNVLVLVRTTTPFTISQRFFGVSTPLARTWWCSTFESCCGPPPAKVGWRPNSFSAPGNNISSLAPLPLPSTKARASICRWLPPMRFGKASCAPRILSSPRESSWGSPRKCRSQKRHGAPGSPGNGCPIPNRSWRSRSSHPMEEKRSSIWVRMRLT